MPKEDNVIVGLDIGTTKICAIVGEVQGDGVDIVGIGTSPSRGLRKGVVINIEDTVESIKCAIEEAELMAGCEINNVFTGIAGGHIKGFNSHGIVAVKDKEVKHGDVRRVVDAAKAVAIPLDREVVHILPQEYVIDEQEGIRDPIGMSGVRLETKVHIVTAAVSSAQNIIKCANKAGLNVRDIVLQQLASSETVLSEDEQDLGVVLVDIGGGTTDIAVFCQGSIVHTAVISLGGNHITNDIAVGLRTPIKEAEKIKQRFGCTMTSMVKSDERIEVPSMGGRSPRVLSRKVLCEIIEPRVEEIFQLVRQEVDRSGFTDLMASGIVITGGSTIMQGMAEMAEQVMEAPVRCGVPSGIGGLVDVVNSPMYSTGVGLVLYGRRNQEENYFKIRDHNVYHKATNRMREWFAEIF